MGYHFLAVFSGTTARPPLGLESPLAAASHRGKSFFDVDHEELERKVSQTLDVRALPCRAASTLLLRRTDVSVSSNLSSCLLQQHWEFNQETYNI